MAEAAAAADQLFNDRVAAAVAAHLAANPAHAPVAAPPAAVTHVGVKLPDFWIRDPKMWFSQAEAQFRRARITRPATMYDHILVRLPEEVVMSVRALVAEIEADPALEDTSYQLLKTALMASFGKTMWQMAYAIIDHPDLGDRRPTAMMAELLALRYETSAPDSLFLAHFLRRLPPSIRDHIAAAGHKTAAEMATHADSLWDARRAGTVSTLTAAVTDSLAAVSVRSPSPHRDGRRRSPDQRQRQRSPDRGQRSDSRRPQRRNTPGRRDNRQRNDNSSLCFYHDQFGVKALKCNQPCAWTEN